MAVYMAIKRARPHGIQKLRDTYHSTASICFMEALMGFNVPINGPLMFPAPRCFQSNN